MNLNDGKAIPATQAATPTTRPLASLFRWSILVFFWMILFRPSYPDPLDDGRFLNRLGQSVSIQQLASSKKGQRLPILLVVWCSYCKSCRQTEPELDRLAKRWAGKAKVVAVDAHPLDTLRIIADHRAAKKLSFPVVQDPAGAFCTALNIDFTTTSLLLDGNGKLVYFGAFFGLAKTKDSGAESALAQLLAGQSVRHNLTPQRG